MSDRLRSDDLGRSSLAPVSGKKRTAKAVTAKVVVDLAVLALYAALAVAMTWPLAARLSSAVLGPPADNLEYVWKLWWFKHALLDLHVSPFTAPDVFVPFGYPVALSETTTANTILGLPLTAAFGEVASYNLLVLGSFILSGWGMYRLVREWTGQHWPGIVAGAVFAFSPYRLAHVGGGHLELLGTQWLPLCMWAAERLLRLCSDGFSRSSVASASGEERTTKVVTTKASWLPTLALGVCFALLALSSWYYAYMGGLFLAVYVILRWQPWRKGRRVLKPALQFGVAILVAAVLILPAALPLLRLAGAGDAGYKLPLKFVDSWSANPLDFVWPSGLHPLWGKAVMAASGQNVNEGLLGLGWVPLALAVWAWAQRKRLPQAPVKLLAGVALGAVVLALGTTLHWGGAPVRIALPAGVVHLFNRGMSFLTGKLALHPVSFYSLKSEYAIVVPLPTLLLYLFLPFFNAMRVWARFGLIANLAVAALAGLGVAAFLEKGRRVMKPALRGLAQAALLALVCFEFWAAPYALGWTEVRGQPLDEWLAGQPRGVVAQFPLDRTWQGPALWAQRVHRQPIAYGYGTFAPAGFEAARPALESFPRAEAIALLRSWGVRYVVVAVESYGEHWPEVEAALAAQSALRPVWQGSDVPRYHEDRLLHTLPASPLVLATEMLSGDLHGCLDDRYIVYELQGAE